MRRFALIFIIALTLFVPALYAGTAGKLAGRVRDESQKGIPFVNVIVFQNGRRLTGALSKENGSYNIINIPPGEYEVRFQQQGFALVIVQNVRINVDQTTTQNVTLTRKSLMLKTIVTVAPTHIVEKDPQGSQHRINTNNIAEMAIDNVTDLISITAGASLVAGELHIRGGRANEINYTVDNMSVSDPVDGGTALQVDPDAIIDMKVMTGGFTAEYGNAQSGVVSIITKEGDSYYSGKLEYNTDRYIGESRNEDAIKFAIGGPVLPSGSDENRDKFTFYLNGGGDWQDGRLRKYAVGDPNADFSIVKSVSLLENEYAKIDPYGKRNQFLGLDLGDRFYNSYNVNFKTKYSLSDLEKVTFAARADRSTNDGFSYLWRYAPDFNSTDETIQQQYVASYDRVLSPTMNLKVKSSYFQKNYNLGPKRIDRNSYFYFPEGFNPDPATLPSDYTDNAVNGIYGYVSIGDESYIYQKGNRFLDATAWKYRIQGVEDARAIPGFVVPGTIYSNFINDKTASVNGKADFEWQFNDIHQLKSGIELISHNIKKDQVFNFLTVYEDRRQDFLNSIYDMRNYVDPDPNDGIVYIPDELVDVKVPEDGSKPIAIYKPEDYLKAAYAASGKSDGYKATPWQAAYYLQDKMEWEGMIVNAGMRLDFWYLGNDYKVLLDNGSYESRPRSEVIVYNSNHDPIDTVTVVGFNNKDKLQMMISPRLGVSHPISDRDVLRFAYNYQNQLPQFQFIFTSRTPADANVSDQIITVGNPALEPQITVTYEVGLTHQVSEDYVLDMTAYYKNLYNYVSTRKVSKPGESQVYWYEYISEDYGSARGLDIQLEKSLSDFNMWSIAYSLAWAQGNNSTTVIQTDQTNLREFPLDWDIRHNFNVNYTFRVARGEEYIVPFTNFILPLDDFSANLTWTLSSGTPYTPTTGTGSQVTVLDTNSRRKGLTQNANLRLTKGFSLPFGALRVFLDVENLFKYPNVGGVFSRTGSALNDGVPLDEDGYTYQEVQFMHDKSVINPGNINDFRAVTLGVSFNF